MDDTTGQFGGSNRDTAGYTRAFLLVILISAVSSVVTPLQSQRLSGRSIIFEEVVERWRQQRDEFSWFVSCATRFIEEYFDQPEWVSFVLPDESQDTFDLAEPLMNELRRKIPVYTLNVGMISIIETYEGAANAIILSENASALEGKDICLTDYCRHECDFMIVLTRPFDDEASFLADIDELIHQLCLRSIFELVILALVGDSAVMAGSPSSRTDGLYTAADAAVLARCEQGGAGDVIQWQRNEERMSHDEYVVNVAMFPIFPYAVTQHTSLGLLRFSGIEGRMIEEIARSAKVQLNREVIEWTNMTVDIELQSRLYDMMNADVIFGGFLWSYSPKIEYTNSYGMVHIAWMVPIHENVSLRGLIAPFRPNVWYAIICSLIIGGLVKYFFIRDITFLDITGLVLGIVVNRQPVKNSSRIQFMAWVLFGFFITQLYLGSLAEQLMNATDAQIETMEELLKSGLKIGGTKELASLLHTPDQSDHNDFVRLFHENFIIFEEDIYNELMADIKMGRNHTVALLVMLNLTDVHQMVNMGHAHIIEETMGTYPLALATWRGFPSLRNFNFKILVCLQTGLVKFWSQKVTLDTNYYEEESEVDDDNNLELQDIIPAFLLLFIGFAGGFLLLIIEILFYPSPRLL